MNLLRTTALTAALMTTADLSITRPAQAQARLAWWGWPGLVAASATSNPNATALRYAPNYSYATGWSYPGYGYSGYNYPAYANGYGTSYGYPASRYAYHPVIRRPITSRPRIRRLYAAGAGIRRHWQ